jgi:hypothetical protein
MNDFTKEELQMLHLDMCININKAPPLNPAPCYVELRDKIQSLIDNYCEHKSPYEVNYGETSFYFCDNCKYAWKES